MSKSTKESDEFANDGLIWREYAQVTYSVAIQLFKSRQPLHLFPAGVLGHHALEQLLKSALIEVGYTITSEEHKDSVWGHNLVALGLKLADRDTSFPIVDLRLQLSIFDSYFYLRSPGYLKGEGIGEEEAETLTSLIQEIGRFATPLPGEEPDDSGDGGGSGIDVICPTCGTRTSVPGGFAAIELFVCPRCGTGVESDGMVQ